MNIKKILPILSIICAIILIIGVSSFAGPCPVAEGEKPMKCVWTANATKGIGVVMALTALVRLLSPNMLMNRGLALAEVFMGIYTIGLPTVLIGTCMHAEMVCNTTMQPFTILVCVIYIALAVAYFFIAGRGEARN